MWFATALTIVLRQLSDFRYLYSFCESVDALVLYEHMIYLVHATATGALAALVFLVWIVRRDNPRNSETVGPVVVR